LPPPINNSLEAIFSRTSADGRFCVSGPRSPQNSGSLAAGTVCFAIWQSSFDPAGREARHRVAAKELLWLREQLLLLITNCQMANADPAQLQLRLEAITQELTTAYKFLPDTSFEAYSAGEKALKCDHFTFSDEEIDAFLPTHLRSAPLPSTIAAVKTD
ncbi:MAG: hypothetical protein ABJC09_14810, partial [Terriglobia bacterium]